MEWVRDHAWEAWLATSLLLGTAEMFNLDLVLLMLAVGAGAGMVAALVGLPLVAQCLVAAAVSVAMLGVVRPAMRRRMHNGPDLKTGTDALIGREGYVLTPVTDQGGQVKIAGEIWTARPYDADVVIAEGAKVQVFEIRGATAYVHEVPEIGQ